MTSKDKRSVTLALWIICKYKKGKRGQKGIEYFVYVVHKLSVSLNSLHQHYRQRFGIESSYRLKNQCLIKTTTKNPIWRKRVFILINQNYYQTEEVEKWVSFRNSLSSLFSHRTVVQPRAKLVRNKLRLYSIIVRN